MIRLYNQILILMKHITIKVLQLKMIRLFIIINDIIKLIIRKLDRYQEALEFLNKAIQINHKSDIALTNKGLTLYTNNLIKIVIKLNQWEAAVQIFDQALQINSKNYKAVLNKGFALKVMLLIFQNTQSFPIRLSR